MATSMHVVHIIYRLDTGGLENGLVNLINRLPATEYQHSIITLNGQNPEFAQRIQQSNVTIVDVAKKPGRDLGCYWRIFRALKKLQPDILHTRNLTSIEYQCIGWLAGTPNRLHGEHGWDADDIGGISTKNQKIRRLFKRFIHHFIGLSSESIRYLNQKVGVAYSNITHICNGVDVERFRPNRAARLNLPFDFQDEKRIVFGTVGRLAAVKNQTLLVDSFIQLWQRFPTHRPHLRLVIVGDGILLPGLKDKISKAGLDHAVWFAGNRNDVAQLLPAMDVFVLPSLAEGISNTILEAMACGVPVIATDVGGNPDLIAQQFATTHLVSSQQPDELTKAMARYVESPEKIRSDSETVRLHCQQHFSIEAMVEKYHGVYQALSQRG
ncbi:TIGR03088 family PEP-CTERM/XrtA system glycosyltransferase [Pseudobowmanella zhangzhouensis]|uniref:TIGR03088 family PEP-CTERM/XrtA system glycosyltransferase n=3 Tax=Alteromonadales TaxID=135622 RepID=A0ABW1XEP8_9ALTE|nr:hypothetical protein TK45_13745 [Bowmanella sp. JS7-9]